MVKFCKHCGKKLKSEEVCNCQTKIKKNTENTELLKATETIKNEVSDSSKKYLEKFGELWKDIWSHPKKTMTSFMKEEDNTLTILILIITSVLIGLCTISFIKGIYTNYLPMNQLMKYSETPYVWNISYFKILLCVSIGVFLSYILLAIIFDLGFEKISQINLSLKKFLAIIAISVFEPTMYCILGAFLTVVSYKLAFIMICFALLLYLINLYQNIEIMSELNTENYNRIFSSLILIFLFLAIYVIPNLFL